MKATPEEVLASLRADIKKNKIRRKHLATVLGFKTEQAVTNLLNSKRYLNTKQAKALSVSYNYNSLYLTAGVGKMRDDACIISPDDHEQIVKSFMPLNCSPLVFDDNAYLIYVLQRFKEVVDIIQNPHAISICKELISFRDNIQTITNRVITSGLSEEKVDEEDKEKAVEVAYGLHLNRLFTDFRFLRGDEFTYIEDDLPIRTYNWPEFRELLDWMHRRYPLFAKNL